MGEYSRVYRRRSEVVGEAAESARVSEWAVAELGFAADERQAELLDSGAQWALLCCSRQWGKSTVTAIRVVHHVLFRPEAMVVVAGFPRKLGMRWRGDGSRVVAVPGREAFVRGFSAVTFLVIDEPSKAADSLYTALTPMLATTDGLLWLMGTPNGQAGFFYKEWVQGGGHWKRMSVPATECGRIGAEFLETERVSQGEDLFRQEYPCEFLPGPGQMFTAEMIDACIEDGL